MTNIIFLLLHILLLFLFAQTQLIINVLSTIYCTFTEHLLNTFYDLLRYPRSAGVFTKRRMNYRAKSMPDQSSVIGLVHTKFFTRDDILCECTRQGFV